MLMALGLFVFEMGTLPFQALERRRGWRWDGGDRVGARPALQFLGPGEEAIRVSGDLYPAIAGDAGSIETLADMAASGESWQLVDGLGRIYGDFVICGIEDAGEAFLDNGVARKIGFSIELKRVA